MKLLIATLLTLTAATAHAAPKTISGSELALRWADLIGETVSVRVTPTRALAPARYLVKVDKTDAVMIIAPGKVWAGKRTVCAAVTGQETLLDKGRTTVVGLMLTDCE